MISPLDRRPSSNPAAATAPRAVSGPAARASGSAGLDDVAERALADEGGADGETSGVAVSLSAAARRLQSDDAAPKTLATPTSHAHPRYRETRPAPLGQHVRIRA